jgi:hypothetical protein
MSGPLPFKFDGTYRLYSEPTMELRFLSREGEKTILQQKWREWMEFDCGDGSENPWRRLPGSEKYGWKDVPHYRMVVVVAE